MTARLPLALGTLVLLVLAWSAFAPFDRLTWFMEVLPVFIALPVLGASYRRFPLTAVLYWLIAFHAVVLIIGGAYTYANVPAGFWVKEWLGLARNPYDKLGHFMQGLVPALVAREILLRQGYLKSLAMAAFLSICVALAVSAVYELIEWAAALALGQGADEFLGTQGDVWDTQSDMFLALLGSIGGLLLFGRLQLAQIKHLGASGGLIDAPPTGTMATPTNTR